MLVAMCMAGVSKQPLQQRPCEAHDSLALPKPKHMGKQHSCSACSSLAYFCCPCKCDLRLCHQSLLES